MSARSGKRFARSQERFVPKSQNPLPREDQIHNHRVRSSPTDRAAKVNRPDDATAASSSSSAASLARVRMGKNGGWVSNRSQGGGSFVKYLPQDEAVAAGLGAEDGALDPVESQRVVDILNRELSWLLKLSPRDFWREVASDNSLHEFLDSYLQFRNRWYDFPHHGAKGIVAGIIVGEFELSRRVFMVLYRILSNKDPGVRASDSLSAKEHGALLQEKKLLDLPRLLDICAIYGHDNEELTRLLVSNAMKAQPTLLESLTTTISHFLNIMHTMYQRCNASLEVLFSSGGHEDHGNSGLYAEFLEVMDFINDAVGSLDAFVDAYKPAAVYFSCPTEIPSGNEELINTLARLHDSLLPSLQRGVGLILNTRVDGTQNSSGDMIADASVNFTMLLGRIVKFGWKLLDLCYFSGELFEGSTPLPTATKMFPAKIDDPLIRGEILIQTFREIHESSLHLPEKQSRGAFLQNIERNYNMLIHIESLRTSGWIFMDEKQFQYLFQIATSHSSKPEKERNVSNPSPSNQVRLDEDAAIMESKISQIKDIFPDYGNGFLSACLEAYNHNPEEVIQRILEGTLHEDLLTIDISLEEAPAPKSAMSLRRNDKGKGALVEPSTTSSPSADLSLSNSLHSVGHGHSSSSSSVQPAPSSYGRFTRKSKDDEPDLKYLDTREAGDSVKAATLAAQYEYEDEYDDSFDELGLSLVESGFEETESLADRISSLPGKSSDAGTSRWQPQKKPQFYVKDGKNYSYKVSGSVAASNAQEAAKIHLSQKELIHGLGRGGNVPFAGSIKKMESEEQDGQTSDGGEETTEGSTGGRGNLGSRGRGRGRGGRSHYRKDRAAKKHFDSLTRY